MTRRFALVSTITAVCFSFASNQASEAITINDSELIVEYAAGSGDNSTYFIIDFGGAPSGDQKTYAFEYRWTPGAEITAATALHSLDDAGAFSVNTTNFGGTLGEYLNGFSYSGDSHVPGFSDPSWNNWWGDYQTSSGGSVAWSEALYGISGLIPNFDFTTVVGNRYIEANGFEGFYSDTYFTTAQPPRTMPALPLTASSVPEPATVLPAIIAALLAAVWWKRRSATR